MLVRRTFIDSIAIKNPISFAEDEEANLMKCIKSKYEGACFGNSRIIRILNIVSLKDYPDQPLRISTNVDDGSADVCVEFEAEAVILEPGEILNGCTVANTKERRGIIHLEHEHANIGIKGDSSFTLNPGQIVSCKILQSQCTQMGEKLTAMATFNLRYDHPIIEATSDFNPAKTTDFAHVDKIISHINSLNEIDNKSNTRRNFFKRFLLGKDNYPATQKGAPIKILGNKYTVTKGKFYREVLDDSNEPAMVEVTDPVIVPGKMSGGDMIYKFLSSYYSIAYTIKSMMEIYPEADDAANSNLWELYLNAE